jgi:prepilin-type N-terminal cleavage/methylation domain-containing protein
MKYCLNKKGFTLIELMVSVGIFALMTTLLVAKFGTFNQGVLLSNVAYDVALTIRNAQSYGLNVKSSLRTGNEFNHPYGVHFVKGNSFIFFADKKSDGYYVLGDDVTVDTPATVTTIKGNTEISSICITIAGTCNALDSLDITFKRPDPNAIIKGKDSSGNLVSGSYAKITLKSSDGSTKIVEILSTGQIAVKN